MENDNNFGHEKIWTLVDNDVPLILNQWELTISNKDNNLWPIVLNDTCKEAGAGTACPSEAPEFTSLFLVGFVLLDL
jgi:hypothetical protein